MDTSFCSSSLIVLVIIIAVILAERQPVAANQPGDDLCSEKKCSPNGPSVRFPFMLREKQHPNCGYSPHFNLYCDQFHRTVLEMPSTPIKFFITNITYISKTMEIQSAEHCIPKFLKDLDFSNTPFQVPPDLQVYNVSLFNCTSSTPRTVWFSWNTACAVAPGYTLIPVPADTDMLFGMNFEFCTKIFDTVANRPVPIFDDNSTTVLNWTLPDCKKCEMHGGICGRESSTNKITCFGDHQGTLLKILHIIGPIIGFFLLALATGVVYLSYSKAIVSKEKKIRIKNFLEDYEAMKPTRYSYADIKKMTNDFKDQLGEGSYGNVFKGEISKDIFVAVKLLHDSKREGEEFVREVETMGKIHHVNVVRLVGYCADGSITALVLEFQRNGSLDKLICSRGQQHHTIGMESLEEIAVGIARGIRYLHQECEQRILHFDIKPHNILLDEDYNPKISDFGLAKLCEKGRSCVSMTTARGTVGYIVPEVFSRQFGNVSYKSDVYSFGILLLEMVGGRTNLDTNVQNNSQVYFPEWVYKRLLKGEELRILAEKDGDERIAKKLAIAGLWCIQWNPVDRPSLNHVIQILEGNGEDLMFPPNPFATENAKHLVDPSSNHALPFVSMLEVISESG